MRMTCSDSTAAQTRECNVQRHPPGIFKLPLSFDLELGLGLSVRVASENRDEHSLYDSQLTCDSMSTCASLEVCCRGLHVRAPGRVLRQLRMRSPYACNEKSDHATAYFKVVELF